MAAKKLRPYRVDYFDVSEMKGDKALVRSVIVRTATAKEAKEFVGADGRFIIKVYRFYKKLTAQPKRKTYLAMENLFPDKKAVEVMEQIEAYRAAKTAEEPTSGPESPATKEVVQELNGMMAHDEHEQLFDTFVPAPQPEPEEFSMSDFETPVENKPDTFLCDADWCYEHHCLTCRQPLSQCACVPDKNAGMYLSSEACPSCQIGKDTNGDGDCMTCTSPVYKQAQEEEVLPPFELESSGKLENPFNLSVNESNYVPPCSQFAINPTLAWVLVTLVIVLLTVGYSCIAHH